jgi:4-amino-4-deoxy-L-arabinose transferase-like glycosyltransferase
MVLALVVRGGVVALAPDSLNNDPDGYRYLAENLLQRGVFGYDEIPSAYRPPLYPLMLTPCVALGPSAGVAIAVVHGALGLATVWLTYRLGRRWGMGNYALLAAALVACDPILLVQSTQVMTETPAALLAVASLVFLTSVSQRPSAWRVMLAGACLGLATLCRATFLPFLILAALAVPMFAQTWKKRLCLFASFAAAAVLVLSPWMVRNQVRFGRPIIATTHGGYTLLLGNNASFYRYLRTGNWGTVWDADEFNRAWRAQATRTRPADEIRNDRLAYARAWETIRREPGTFFYSCAVRAGRFWAPLPHQVDRRETPAKRSLRYLVGLWYLVELALAALGVAALWRGARRDRDWWRTWLWAVLLAASFTAVHTLYWSNLRMRAPLMPVVALAASAGVAWIAARCLGRKSLSDKTLGP